MNFLNSFLDFYFGQNEFKKDALGYNLKTCVIFPNQRGCLFFQKYYAGKVASDEKTHILPAIFAWEDFVFHITGRVRVSTTTAIMMLYELIQQPKYVDYFKDKTLEKVWLVLKKVYGDFRRVDLAMMDEKKFFSTASEHWELKFWQPGDEHKESEEKLLEFYKNLGCIHAEFKQKLLNNNLAYFELALRDVIENKRPLKFSYNNLHFVGVVSNGKIFHQSLNYFQGLGIKVQHFVDYDPYYVSSDFPEHEAGKAYSLYFPSEVKNEYQPSESKFREPKKVQVYGIPLGYNQVGFLINKLREIYDNNPDNLSRVGIVLADIHLLLPLMKALPPEIAIETNFSMGFPLKLTIVYSLVKELIKFRMTVIRKKVISQDQIKSILLHPIVLGSLNEKKHQILEFFEKYPFISKSPYNEIKKKLEEFSDDGILSLITSLLSSEHEPMTTRSFEDIAKILMLLYEHMSEDNELERLAIEEVINIFNIVKNKKQEFNLDEGSIWSVVLHELNSLSLTLKGDPLKGLQVLGPLETSVLDFEHVFILGFNEGMWPATPDEESYIPYQIRKNYGMNITHYLHYRYAYEFYRLLQHAKTMEIFYNNIVDERYGKEPSHYIKQVEYELKPWTEKNGIQFIYEHVSLGTTALYIDQLNENDKIPIKEKKTMELSFSELYDYVVCPYKFALKHIKEIRPKEELSLEYASNELGNYAHKILELIIKEIQRNNISSWCKVKKYFNDQHLNQIIQQADEEVLKKIENPSRYNYSFNSLMREIVIQAVRTFLDLVPGNEKQNNNFSSLEAEIQLAPEVNINGTKLKLKGKLDLLEISIRQHAGDDSFNGDSPDFIVRDFKLISQLRESFYISPDLDKDKFLREFINNRYRSQLLYYAMLLYLQNNSPNCNDSIVCELVVLLSNDSKGMFRKILNKDKTPFHYSKDFHDNFFKLFSDSILSKYIEESEWKATPGKCQFCEYQNICYAFEG